MCGRFSQYQAAIEYFDALDLQLPLLGGMDPEPLGRYNVAPTTKVLTIAQEGGGVRMAKVPWGYAPWWAKGKRPPAINARGETAATSKFFRDAWPHRSIVPADGWYEWKKDAANPKIKQPYNIRLATGRPMFFAAIGQMPRADRLEPGEGDGLVIITADSDEGMVDIHDRMPVVLSEESAAHWLDPELTSAEAEEILREHGRPIEDFAWYPVSQAVGNVRNESPHLIEPINDPLI